MLLRDAFLLKDHTFLQVKLLFFARKDVSSVTLTLFVLLVKTDTSCLKESVQLHALEDLLKIQCLEYARHVPMTV